MKWNLGIGGFAKYAWFVLGYNVLVILWGVFLRASRSGDGCGQHWITCHGEVVPSAPELKTIIEFSHRVTSAVAGLLVVLLVVWTIDRWYKAKSPENGRILRAAVISLVFIVIEGLLGAGLVLTGNTAENLTPARPLWMAGHLVNTLILLAFLTATAWFASGGRAPSQKSRKKELGLLVIGAIGLIFVGITGSIAALSSMIFPADTLTQGLTDDFSATSHFLLRLRPLHPITAIAVGVYLIFFAGWLGNKLDEIPGVAYWSRWVSRLVIIQIIFGAATLFTLAPIVMQLGHLLLVDAVWISLVLLALHVMQQVPEADSPPG